MGLVSDDTGFDALRTERWISVIRLAIVAVVIAISVGSGVDERPYGPVALGVLALAVVYSTWSLVAFSDPTEPSVTVRVVSLSVDLAFVTTWVVVSGPTSDYWVLYLIVLVSSSLRFDLPRTMGTAAAIALLYGSLLAVDGAVSRDLVVQRLSAVFITGFAVGVLSQQRLLHRTRGQALETEVQERARELTTERAEVERLRRVDVLKSEFVAVAAHEFRTPLAAIVGVLATLRQYDGELSVEERQELLDGASTQAQRLGRLVDDLLTVSRIEDGDLGLTFASVDPRELLAEAAEVSGMVGRLEIRIGRVGRVRCDPDAAIRVLTNLLDNARKYSPPDSTVRVDVGPQGDMLRFRVADEGPGVPEQDRAGVFERFRRLNGAQGKAGAGLGLYICRGLVEAHGGTIAVGEAPGGGAEFSFTLPLATSGLPAPDAPDVAVASGV